MTLTPFPRSVDGILFEIARTLDFCRSEPGFPESIPYKTDATAFIKARCTQRGIEMELIEWKGGAKQVVGGDWYEIPALLRELSELIEATQGSVKRFAGQFSPQNVLTLQAKGADGVLSEWSLAFSAEDAAKALQESSELVALADDASGIPEDIVGALQELNEWLRGRLFPLKPKATIPVKFWKIADPVVLWSALQYLYGYLLKPFGYDESAIPPLPAGYTTVCTIFHAFEEIDNEGTETAIENLGTDYCDALAAELGRVGLAELGDLFRAAWRTHPLSTSADSAAFEDIIAKLHDRIEDDVTLDAICRYVGRHPQLFEER